ncbi:Nucleoside-diphosphate-sugar epimerase [Tessaracoccus bendigoensis DSM 12906]|uniref:Nucleoside-diphosphate-sugar epimerase n=1 Tax=Tessaracoccus bendigoensis DSM 12906 TaxID=1123357 RepID=A0A1M6NA05_9ACTN|nr:Nucleoside-diphosphate-sugar epimerase [Tessaracoccus bendigoensis DSM 12906]
MVVTGASGYVGTHIVDALLGAGHQVLALSRRPVPERPGLRWLHWDLTQTAPSDLPEATAVVHAAAHVNDWDPWPVQQRVTVNGTARVLAAFPTARIVLVSSCSVYPLVKGLVDESVPPTTRPLSPYPRAKIAQEELVGARPGSLILRPHAVYGPGDPTLLPRLSAARVFGRFLVPSGRRTLVHLTHVDLLAAACVAAVERPEVTGIVNVADADALPALDIVRAISTANGWPERPLLLGEALTWTIAVALEAWGHASPARKHPLLTRYSASHVARSRIFVTTRLDRDLGVAPTAPRLSTWTLEP